MKGVERRDAEAQRRGVKEGKKYSLRLCVSAFNKKRFPPKGGLKAQFLAMTVKY